MYLLEHAIRADVALVEAWQADRWGNLTYKLSGRNFNPIMAMAAEMTIVQAQNMVELGDIGPDDVHTPGVFVKRVVHVPYGGPAANLATTG
jgi:3-oxoadipate CoA-transferase alpha subunit